ncbi:MAG: NAD(P)-dependent oxidoreductase [Polyangiaceae bacterium]|nr:NAD(P)-dependent oxidoreductase [Polyangiaceae bacterium]
MRTLITGGAGFIGFHLAKRLAATGHTVHLVDNLARGVVDADLDALLELPNVRLLQRNLLAPHALDDLGTGYEYIYHLAAIIGVSEVLRRPYSVLADNARMLLSLVEFARNQSHLRRLVFASTSEVYAGLLENFTLPIPTPETVALGLPDLKHPRASYMLSKIYGEALCQQSGLPFTLVRPHNFYGPRMGLSHVVPELMKRAHTARAGGVLDVYSVDHRRTFCFIDDAVAMLDLAAASEGCLNETLNIGTQEPDVTIGELATKILETVGVQLTIVAKPPTPGSPARRCPDMAKTTRLTGYRSLICLEEGLRRTFAWYRAKVFEGNRPCAI